MRGPRHYVVLCIDALCGWVGHRTGDNRVQVEKNPCPRCKEAVVAKKP